MNLHSENGSNQALKVNSDFQGGSQENYEDIKEALEYQIDIVLRLEEERLVLLKETKSLRQMVKELTEKQDKRSIVVPTKNAETQASIAIYYGGKDVMTQTSDLIQFTEGEEELSDSILQYSQNQSIMTLEEDEEEKETQSNASKTSELFQKAQQLLKKSEDKVNSIQESSKTLKKSNNKLPIKSLQFKKKDSGSGVAQNTSSLSQMTSASPSSIKSFQVPPEKENSQYSSNNTMNEKKQKEQTDILTQELVKLTRENNQMKKEMQKISELHKKQAKESLDMKKIIDVKNEMLDKLRGEVAELSLVLNSDKNKSLRSVESSLRKEKEQFVELKREYEKVFEEKSELKEELLQFKGILSKLTQEYDKIAGRTDQAESAQKIENQKLKERIQELEQQQSFRSQQNQIREAAQKENQLQTAKLLEEIEYYKRVSIKSKEYAQKAIQDIDFYRELLKQHNIQIA